MVDGANAKAKQQSPANNKSFNDQNQTKVDLLLYFSSQSNFFILYR